MYHLISKETMRIINNIKITVINKVHEVIDVYKVFSPSIIRSYQLITVQQQSIITQ